MDIDDLVDNSDEDSSSSSDYLEEETIMNEEVECLFCARILESVPRAISHARNDHQFHLYDLRDKHKLDAYGYIKLINYLRTEKPEPKVVMDFKEACWMSDSYLKPVNINDPFLWFDLPVIDTSTIECEPKYINSEDGKVTMSQSHLKELQRRIHELTIKVKEKDDQIEALRILLTDTDSHISKVGPTLNTSDVSYFNSYSVSSIHNDMLQDQPRMIAFRDVFTKNGSSFKNKSVLDVGCGTGILAMFAAAAGAKDVVGVDESDILYQAFDIVRENNLHDRIKLVKGRLEKQELPFTQFDVIVSEWMGYFLMFEAMLESVIYARDHYLAPGGIMLPSRASMQLCALSDLERHKEVITFWEDVCGFRMSCMKTLSLLEPLVESVNKEAIIADVSTIYSLDINNCKLEDMNFTSNFKMLIKKDSTLTAFAGSFEVYFDLPHPVVLSTSVECPITHWKQTIFYVKKPIPVKAGQQLDCQISCRRRTSNVRSFDITLTVEGTTQCYVLF